MVGGIVAVGAGAALGAWMRWGLSAWLNPRLPHFPLGTLAANLIGGYLVGFAVAYFAVRHDLAPQMRLFTITGFLGGLTTFSTFSAEVTTLLVRREWLWSALTIGFHVVGSVALTVLGILLARMLFTWGSP